MPDIRWKLWQNKTGSSKERGKTNILSEKRIGKQVFMCSSVNVFMFKKVRCLKTEV